MGGEKLWPWHGVGGVGVGFYVAICVGNGLGVEMCLPHFSLRNVSCMRGVLGFWP